MIIDDIKLGKKMPSSVLDYETYGPDIQQILSVEIGHTAQYCYTYIPYYPNNINCSVLKPMYRNAISSRFSGCYMVAWEENGMIIAGHVHIAKEHSCLDLWDRTWRTKPRSFTFRPSDVFTNPMIDVNSPNFYGIIIFDDAFENLAAFGVYADADNIVRIKDCVYKGPFSGHISVLR